jgi:hypothetical protein
MTRKPRPYLIAAFPYVGDGLGVDPRFPSLEKAEQAARDRTQQTGEMLNIVLDKEGDHRIVLGTTRRDANERVWTDLANEGAPLL